ncbi:MAG: GGDEF domain-containing protein [Betaproteobacteria bacterium]|nr:GGDEF domain-containing protein [Betaproteobacteria bacterium]
MRLPLSILLATLLLVATMAGGWWVDQRIAQMHARHVEVASGLERMVRLNQALAGMAMVAVLEENALRSASYETVHAELEATAKTIETLTRELALSDEVAPLAEPRRTLRSVEFAALTALRADDWSSARGRLFSEDYVLAKKIYEIEADAAVGTLSREMADAARRFDRLRAGSLAARAAAVLLLLWAGFSFSRRLAADLAEQARLREAVAAANRQLEDKVRERTAALEEANRQLEALSTTDALTGLANRRCFDQAWDAEWQRATRQGLPLAVAMLDVDEFKAYNDTLGHQAGDHCLQRVAQVLRATAQRAGELAARYGGEEFVVILPGLGPEEAGPLAERMRQIVQDLGIVHPKSGAPGVVTVSIGVATGLPQPGDFNRHLVEAADSALYEAKRQGRNRVVIAGAAC